MGEGPKVEMIVVSMWMVFKATLRGEGSDVGGGGGVCKDTGDGRRRAPG